MLVAAAALATIASAALTVAPLAAAAVGVGPGELEAAFTGRIASERLAQGRAELAVESDLVDVARRHSAAMASQSRLYHNTLLGQQVQGWQLVGENVGTGTGVDDVHRALMASETHRGEILDPRFDGVGVGVIQSGGAVWVTQVFRQRSGAPPESAGPPSPTPLAPVRTIDLATDSPPTTRPAPARRRPAPVSITTTTTTTILTTTTLPPEVDLAAHPVAVSAPLPTRPAVVDAGLLGAALLWMVVAGLTRMSLAGLSRVGAGCRRRTPRCRRPRRAPSC